MIPWSCDALLTRPERYASLKFRRMARRFDWTRMGYADGAELCAFLAIVPIRWSRYLFEWRASGVASAERVLKHLSDDDGVARAVDENMAALDRETGLAVLRVLHENGWAHGQVPDVVRRALLDMRDEGISQPRIARETGLTLDQVRVMANGPRRPNAAPLDLGTLVAH